MKLHHPPTSELQLSTVLYALSDPVRLAIVTEIWRKGEQACGDFELPVVKSTVSHHVRTLRESGVIRVRAQGVQRHISLRTEDLEQRFPGLLMAVLAASEDAKELTDFLQLENRYE